MLQFLSNLFSGTQVNFKELMDKGAVIIDVRSPAEFNSGHVKNAINIPLDQIGKKTNEIKKMNKPIITCCFSGSRSGMAKSQLAEAGIEVYNGGNWSSLQSAIK